MATKDQYTQLIKKITPSIELISTIEISDLIREDELGSQLSFGAGKEIFIKTIDLINRIKGLDLSEVPYNLLTNFNNQLASTTNTLVQIRDFNPNQANPVNVKNSLITNLENQHEGLYQHSIPLLTIRLLQGNDLSLQQQKINQLIETTEKQHIESKKQSLEYLKKLSDTLISAEEAAAKVGVSKHSAVFMKESTDHESQAKFWIKWTIAVLVTIVVASSLLILLFPGKEGDINAIVQYSITKLVILSTLFYGLAICSRNYKAHRHNALVNRHRQNALTTFETFSKAAGNDAQTKAAVLMEATRTIFGQQTTGYLTNDKESDSSNRIVEIFKNVAGDKE